MKKILTLVAALFLGMLALAGPAAATGGGQPDADNKKVTLCHATGSETNPYTKITVSVMAFYNAGHIDHEGDIWEAFSYTDNRGNVVKVPARGATDLLAFEDCEAPKEPTKVTPTVSVVDKCETADDSVSVSVGEGYESKVVRNGLVYTVSVTANEGFILDLDNTWTVSDDGQRGQKVFTLTDEDCDLPVTGGEATYNTALGGAALAGVILLAAAMLLTRKRV